MTSETQQNLLATAAVLTPPGAGAVAVIEVSLRDAADTEQIFQAFSAVSGRSLRNASVGRIIYGRWNGEDIVILRTAATRWEIHCHGGTIAVDRVLADLQKAIVTSDHETHRPEPNRVESTSRQIDRLLLQCRTRRTAGLVLAQLDGRLQTLLDAANSDNETLRHSARQHIERWKGVANHLTRAWRIAIVGSPNVGKSSLINALAGLDRSIVSSTPGTTRDLVEVEIVVDGWTFQLVDTAGVRDATECVLEGIGIEQSLTTLRDCDLVCLVMDVTTQELQQSLLEPLQLLHVPLCLLWNKCDLLRKEDMSPPMPDLKSSLPHDLPVSGMFSVSALSGAGLPEFLQWLVRILIPEEPTAETVLPLLS